MLPRTEFSLDETSEADVSPLLQVNQPEQQFHRHLTLGIEQKLKENRMIKDVKVIMRKPTDKLSLSSWERKYCLILPQDLKEFYTCTNGWRLGWSLEHAGDTFSRIGEMNINPLNQLIPVDSINTSSSSMDQQRQQILSSNSHQTSHNHNGHKDTKNHNNNYPQMSFMELQQNISSTSKYPSSSSHSSGNLSLGTAGRAFRLDCNRSGWGTVCLVFPKGNAGNSHFESKVRINNSSSSSPSSSQLLKPPVVEIWFMDPSCQWHFLAPTFTHYYRMLLIHLGLPQWQYRFTPFGLSAWAEHIFWIVAPHLLQPPKMLPNISRSFAGLWSNDFPTDSATPNTTNNVISINLFRKKKKVT